MPYAERKRNRILNAAIAVFIRNGYEKSSMEEIAAEAKIGKTTIYYYFSSKEEMFVMAVCEAYNRFFGELDSRLSQVTGFEQRFRTVLMLPLRYIFENIPVLQEAQLRLSKSYYDEIIALREGGRQHLIQILRSLFEDGMAEGILSESVNVEDAINIIHDWLIMTELNLSASDKDMILSRLERDRDKLIDMILYGIIKRG